MSFYHRYAFALEECDGLGREFAIDDWDRSDVAALFADRPVTCTRVLRAFDRTRETFERADR